MGAGCRSARDSSPVSSCSAGRRVGRGVRTAACARGARGGCGRPGGAGGADVEAAASAPGAADELAAIESASMAIVTLAVSKDGLGEVPGSGFAPRSTAAASRPAHFLRPSGMGRRGIAGCVLPARLGRAGRRGGRSAAIRRAAGGARGPRGGPGARAAPAEAARRPRPAVGWGLPQYAVGHVARVARVRAATEALRVWNWPARHTRGWASPPASPADAVPRPGWPPTCRSPRGPGRMTA